MRAEQGRDRRMRTGVMALFLATAACAAPAAGPASPDPAAVPPAGAPSAQPTEAETPPADLTIAPIYAAEIEALASEPEVREAFRVIDSLRPRTRADHIALTEIPAPPFGEEARARRYAELLREAGADSVWIDAEGNVLALQRGTVGGNTIVLSGHLDTVFPEGTDVTVRVSGDTLFAPGVGDDTRGLSWC